MILLTGAAGFVGSNVLRALNGLGEFEIFCVDDLTDGQKVRNISDCQYFYYSDYRDIGKGKSRDIALSAIIHLGADTDTTNQNGRMVMLNNYFSVDLLGCKTANCRLSSQLCGSSTATQSVSGNNKKHELLKR